MKIWDPDTDSDEKSAGLSLQTGRLGEGFVNLKLRMCDPTHAARRVLPPTSRLLVLGQPLSGVHLPQEVDESDGGEL